MVAVEATASTDFVKAIEITIDADGNNIATGLNINYNTGALEDGDVGGGLFIQMDESDIVAASGSTVLGAIALGTTTTSDAIKRGLVVLPGFTSAFTVLGADAEDPDFGYETTSGSSTDRVNGAPQPGTAFLSTSTSDLEIFDNNGDDCLWGSSSTFEDLEVVLSIGSSLSINPTFWYSTAGDTYTSLVIQGDGTSGFQQSGNIVFDAPGDWVTTTEDIDGNAVSEAYYVAITRTRGGNLAVLPTEDHFKTFADLDQGMRITGRGGIVTNKRAADPCGDTTQFPEGTLFYNDTKDVFCFCDGAGDDLEVHDNSVCF